MSSAYDFAPSFLIRMAGVPFDPIWRLATPQTSAAARALLVRQEQVSVARTNLESYLRAHRAALPPVTFRAWKKAARSQKLPLGAGEDLPPPFSDFAGQVSGQADIGKSLDDALAQELSQARSSLAGAARAV